MGVTFPQYTLRVADGISDKSLHNIHQQLFSPKQKRIRFVEPLANRFKEINPKIKKAHKRDDFPLTPKISDLYMKALYHSIFSKNQEVSIDVWKIACIHHTI
ncbi:hypothetical protein BpHYR1_010405 [Brachionus plicatilis]|uniref:Uncharacterized protein n=1 Tax=Brachionus plicatilis TaxID=10195 RepID=A0A3M7QEK1_BRAPC|nr:hypothetical protein BpHYR1_010405 [Brachionus plicatilis]